MDGDLIFIIIVSILFNFMPFIIILIFILVVTFIIKKMKSSNITVENLNKENVQDIVSLMKMIKNKKNSINQDDITQEEIHAHDFTAVNQDDISQQEIHEHQPWNDEGPIKYN